MDGTYVCHPFGGRINRLEATLALAGGNVGSAFRSFYHRLLLERDLPDFDVEAYITLGIPLARGPRENLDSDYREWVAATSASLAASILKNEAAVVAFQSAGMCSSDLGWIRETGEHYERAVTFFNDKLDSAVADGVRMSYRLSYISLLVHTDFDPEPDPSVRVRVASMLDTAREHRTAGG